MLPTLDFDLIVWPILLPDLRITNFVFWSKYKRKFSRKIGVVYIVRMLSQNSAIEHGLHTNTQIFVIVN